MEQRKSTYKNLPETPGVYLMRGVNGKILYVGKAGNLRRRVSSYFVKANEARIEKLISEIKKIDCLKTDSALEALILEAELIKKYEPPFNVREKDGTSFLYIEIAKEEFPRVLLVRGKSETQGERFGPFVSASSARQALRLMRKLFPWSVHPPEKIGKFNKACFDYEIGLCPGTCLGTATRKEYLKNIRHIRLFLAGKKKKVLSELKKEMSLASRSLAFERADKLKRRVFALQHIQDIALISGNDVENFKLSPKGRSAFGEKIGNSVTRIEGYDISNISGNSAVGSMVVFVDGRPDKKEYRKFKIKTVAGADDVSMLKEVLRRRFKNEWLLPNLVLVDGGKPQVNAARAVLNSFSLNIPVVGIAKGPNRKKNELIGIVSPEVQNKTLIQIRDEAHRFAISYHRKVRNIKFRE